MITRYVVDLDSGGELVVVKQNAGDAQGATAAEGERVHLSWHADQTYRIQASDTAPDGAGSGTDT